jgi:hypothetical protein
MKKNPSVISRRELLKILGVSAGAAGASLLIPAKWTKPTILSSVLPAHAQSTAALEIIRGALVCGEAPVKANVLTPPYLIVYYQDALGGVNGSTLVQITTQICTGGSCSLQNLPVCLGGEWQGNGFAGSVAIPKNQNTVDFLDCTGFPNSLCFKLIDGARESNKFCLDTLCPEETQEPD